MALAATSNNGPAALEASELMTRSRQSAAALEALLQDASRTSATAQHDGIRELAGQIVCCLDRALAALHGEGATTSKKRTSPTGATAQAIPKRRARATGTEMPTRVEKRSMPDDGLLWRKYGQKVILNSKYPRTYFRCPYKYDNGCKATRQVQLSEDDPSFFIVTYFGEHTCGMDAATTATVRKDENSPQLVISFGAVTTSSCPPWPSSSDDDAGSNSLQFSQAMCLLEEERGEQKADVARVESSVPASPAEPSSSADVSCTSPDLDSLLHYFDWDDSCGDSLFDMDGIHQL